ncbi:MAG: N-acetylmuramoyl-L-alanine amidase-like domain-containing protein [Fidelibacterota bacterium]
MNTHQLPLASYRSPATAHHSPVLLFFTFYFLLTIGYSNQDNWVSSLPKPWSLNEEQISEILPQFYQHYPDFHDRLKAFAVWQVGKPYEIYKLGDEVEPDPDPIIRLDVSDCTVHVLTSLAFSQSKSWEEARSNMIAIHYKDGIPSYKSRWHYTTDRIQENPSTVNITEKLLDKNQLEKINITLNKKEDDSEFLDLDWEKNTSVYFIPNQEINKQLLKKLPEVCGVAFVRIKYFKIGIVIAHEGMIIDQQNLVHASSEYGETVSVDFMKYYFRDDGPVFDGIMIYSFHPLSGIK